MDIEYQAICDQYWPDGCWIIDGSTFTDDEAGAKIIQDALKVHTRTGLTPSELAEQRDMLKKALSDLAADVDEYCPRTEYTLPLAKAALTKATETK